MGTGIHGYHQDFPGLRSEATGLPARFVAELEKLVYDAGNWTASQSMSTDTGLSRSRAILAFAGIVLASCGEGPPDRPISYRGEYHYDMEKAYLVQVGVDAKICIQGADMTPAVQPEFSESGGVTDVAVRGILSKPGRYGHEEACTYMLSNAELLGVGERRARE